MKIDIVETIRVWFEDVYCDIVPSADEPRFYDYWLHRKGYGVSVYMFGGEPENKDEAIKMAVRNVPEYIPDLMAACEEGLKND